MKVEIVWPKSKGEALQHIVEGGQAGLVGGFILWLAVSLLGMLPA